nr:NAD-dependent epimerase/dehydratase family protein [Candidatus Sigynarchaeota archaeon]
MDKVLILGINGFTGKHFQQYLAKNGLLGKLDFVGVDRAIGTADRMEKIEYLEADVVSPGTIERLLKNERPAYIINLAGLFGAADFTALFQVNAEVSRRILATIVDDKVAVKRVLLIGSAAEYGIPGTMPVKESHPLNPISPYGLTKMIQAMYANYYFRNFGTDVVVARTFNILGKGLSPKLSVGSFAEQVKNLHPGGTLKVGNLNTKRDFLDIEDTIDAYWKLLHSGKPGQVYNVCSGKSVYIKEILEFLISTSGKNASVQVDGNLVRKNDILDFVGDNSKLRADAKWNARVDIHESLKAMIA